MNVLRRSSCLSRQKICERQTDISQKKTNIAKITRFRCIRLYMDCRMGRGWFWSV